MRLLCALLLCLLWMLPAHAQDSNGEPLTVPFASAPPFMFFEADGSRAGFTYELAIEIGEELGVPIAFADASDFREFVALLAAGDAQMMPGIVQLPPLRDTNIFSDVLVSDRLRFTIRVGEEDGFDAASPTDRRIGIVPPAIGSEEPILDQNIPVSFETAEAALVALLAGTVDALLMPPPVAYDLARGIELDGRITFVGEPLRETTRHVALHESRADLMPAINEALARMEADGRLPALRRRYSLEVPPPAPEVLRIGVTHLPPVSLIAEDGTLSGFNVEVVEAIADRADVAIELVPLALTDWVRGPTANGLDGISALVINDARREFMDFSYPVLERVAVVTTATPETITASRLADLAGLRVGLVEGSIFARRAESEGLSDLVGFATNVEIVEAQLRGDIDVGLMADNVAREAVTEAGADDTLALVALSQETIETAIALRPGLGVARDRFDEVIPGYLLSAEFAALRERYFGEPQFWTPTRIYSALATLGGLTVVLLGYGLWQRQNQRLKALEVERQQADLLREKEHNEQMGKLVEELERSNRELDDFAYIASHDLKEPLRGIAINANFLIREGLPGKAGERVERMSHLAGRMESLVSDLLAFSRLTRSGGRRVTIEPASVIADIRNELSEWLTENSGEIIEVGTIPPLNAQRVKIKTALQNLIVNGIKYNDARKKRVEVGFATEAEVNGQRLKNAIFVRDNGIGIAEGMRDKIFRIFSRLNKEADYGPGTGSGLAFVRKIAEEQGGVVDYNSKPGEGSTFYLTLPLAQTES